MEEDQKEPFVEVPKEPTRPEIVHQRGKPIIVPGMIVETTRPRPYEEGGNPAEIIRAEGVTPQDIDKHIIEASKGMVEQDSAATDELSVAEGSRESNVEPSSIEIAKALDGTVPTEDLHELEGMEIDEALGYAFTLLLENGIEDPEEFLKEKGILE